MPDSPQIDREWLNEKIGRILDRVEYLCECVKASEGRLSACKEACMTEMTEIFERLRRVETTQELNSQYIADQKTRESQKPHWLHTYGVWATLAFMLVTTIIGILVGLKIGEGPSPHHVPHLQKQSDSSKIDNRPVRPVQLPMVTKEGTQ